jgi:predicted site-specific integrase-resolvase
MKWDERFYRPSEAASISGVNYKTIQKWIERGELVVTIFDRTTMISHSELLRTLSERCPELGAALEAREIPAADVHITQG